MPELPPRERRLELLRERWERDPGSMIFLQLAEEYRRLGRHQAAIAVLQEGLGSHPRYLSAQVALGRCRLEAGEPAAATEVLAQVVTSDPTQMVASKLLVEAHLALSKAEEARARLEAYRLLNPHDPEIESLERRLLLLEPQEGASPETAAEQIRAAGAGPEAVPAQDELGSAATGDEEVGPGDVAAGVVFALEAVELERPALDRLPRPSRVDGKSSLREPFPELAIPVTAERFFEGLFPPQVWPRETGPWLEEEEVDEGVEPAVSEEEALEAEEVVLDQGVPEEPEVAPSLEPDEVMAAAEPFSAAADEEEPAAAELAERPEVEGLQEPPSEEEDGAPPTTAIEGIPDRPSEPFPQLAPQELPPSVDELLGFEAAPEDEEPAETEIALGQQATEAVEAFPEMEPEPWEEKEEVLPAEVVTAEPLPVEEPLLEASVEQHWAPEAVPEAELLAPQELEQAAAIAPAETAPEVEPFEAPPVEEAPAERPPATEPLTVTLGELYLAQGHYREARRIFQELLRREPENERAELGLAKAWERSEHLRAADLVGAEEAQGGLTDRKILLLKRYLRHIRRWAGSGDVS